MESPNVVQKQTSPVILVIVLVITIALIFGGFFLFLKATSDKFKAEKPEEKPVEKPEKEPEEEKPEEEVKTKPLYIRERPFPAPKPINADPFRVLRIAEPAEVKAETVEENMKFVEIPFVRFSRDDMSMNGTNIYK